jgi:Na+-translocating ferredoxin:NAD+ oxidoreductase subunit B
MNSVLADRIDALLPQTQCGQCGHAGCRPYAEALARDETDLNRCPPGGRRTIAELAELLDRPVKPLDPACGSERPRAVARIVEADCIGCTRCIQACPVDAIVGAARLMHTVLVAECTGCELCLPPCPTDCIIMLPVEQVPAIGPPDWTREQADHARRRHQARQQRLVRIKEERARRPRHKPVDASDDPRKAVIAAARARAEARRNARQASTDPRRP